MKGKGAATEERMSDNVLIIISVIPAQGAGESGGGGGAAWPSWINRTGESFNFQHLDINIRQGGHLNNRTVFYQSSLKMANDLSYQTRIRKDGRIQRWL